MGKRKSRLKQCLDIPPELEQYVNDYKVNVFSVAYLSPEKVRQFKSDFRIVRAALLCAEATDAGLHPKSADDRTRSGDAAITEHYGK